MACPIDLEGHKVTLNGILAENRPKFWLKYTKNIINNKVTFLYYFISQNTSMNRIMNYQ